MATSETLPTSEHSLRGDSLVRPRMDVRPHLHEALGLLLQAHEYAVELNQDVWDLAVELDVLRGARLSNSDLRWLAGMKYVEHAVETTGLEDQHRHFRRTSLLAFNEPLCFVLTSSGVAVARDVCGNGASVPRATAEPAVSRNGKTAQAKEAVTQPKWDQQRRQLRIGATIVKEFKLSSPNQETVLTAFEEEGWPPRIDDPLPPLAQLDPRRRLHDTIKALNRKQRHQLLRFMGDGSGEGIRWELLAC